MTKSMTKIGIVISALMLYSPVFAQGYRPSPAEIREGTEKPNNPKPLQNKPFDYNIRVSWWDEVKPHLTEGEDYKMATIRVFSRTPPSRSGDIPPEDVLIVPRYWYFGWLSSSGTWTINLKAGVPYCGPEGYANTPASGEFIAEGFNQGQLVGKVKEIGFNLDNSVAWAFKGLLPQGHWNPWVENLTLRFYMNDVDKESCFHDNDGWITCQILMINPRAIRRVSQLNGVVIPQNILQQLH